MVLFGEGGGSLWCGSWFGWRPYIDPAPHPPFISLTPYASQSLLKLQLREGGNSFISSHGLQFARMSKSVLEAGEKMALSTLIEAMPRYLRASTSHKIIERPELAQPVTKAPAKIYIFKKQIETIFYKQLKLEQE